MCCNPCDLTGKRSPRHHLTVIIECNPIYVCLCSDQTPSLVSEDDSCADLCSDLTECSRKQRLRHSVSWTGALENHLCHRWVFIYIYVCVWVCVSLMQWQCRTEFGGPLRCVSLSFVHDTHSAVSSVSSVYQFVLPLWLSDNAAMWGLEAQSDRVISSGLADENFVWTCQDFKHGEINTAEGKRIICTCHNLYCVS